MMFSRRIFAPLRSQSFAASRAPGTRGASSSFRSKTASRPNNGDHNSYVAGARTLLSGKAIVGCGALATLAFCYPSSAECHGGHSHGHHGHDHGHDHGHHGHDHDSKISKLERQISDLRAQLQKHLGIQQTTGQGNAVFSWDRTLTAAFPAAAEPFEKDMHGGFSEDDATGIVYTGIPGYGLCQISPDLKDWARIGTDERLKDNIHGICVFRTKGDETLIAVAQNDKARVLIVDLSGNVRQQLDQPKGGEFNFDEANHYYSKRPTKQLPWGTPHVPAFACTDVTFLDGRLYVVTGYCDGDFVLSAELDESKGDDDDDDAESQWIWGPFAWGGKGDGPGQFQTAHGIFAYDDHLFVANREAHEVLEFTKEGRLIRCMPDIPDSARICNVSRAEHDGYFVMNALEPVQHTPAKTAAIYAHSGERLLSTIEPGELGIPVLKHLHHVWPHYFTDSDGTRTLYLLVHGWSAGKFAVLRHEPEGKPSKPNGWGGDLA